MNKPNLYNFFKFIKNKTGKSLENKEQYLKLKLLYSPDDLDEEDRVELSNATLKFNQNLPKGFPNGNYVKEVTLIGKDITEIPADLKDVGAISLVHTENMVELPPLTVKDFSTYRTNISELPKDFKPASLFLSKSPIQILPHTDHEIRLLSLDDCPITTLEGVKARSLYLQGNLPNLKQLPENFHCGLSIYISDNTAITELPKGLKVGWILSLLCEPQFDTLPDDLEVGNTIEVYQMPTYYPEHLKSKIKVVEKKIN